MNTDTRRALGQRVNAERKRRHWSQKDLHEASGVSVGAISNFERGLSFPQPNHLRALLEALEISMEGERVRDSGDGGDTSPSDWLGELHDDVRTALYMLGLYLERFDAEERDVRIREIVSAIIERRL